LLGSVVFFVTVINLFFGQEENSINLKQIIIGTISIILIVTGVWLIYNSKYHNKDYIFKNELDNYYTKQEFNKQTSIENQKIQKIFDCTKYSDGF
jgi:glucose uptake protein GlcU